MRKCENSTIPENDSEALLVSVIIGQMWSHCFLCICYYTVLLYLYTIIVFILELHLNFYIFTFHFDNSFILF